MQNQITIIESNKPSSNALKAFNQQIFNDIKSYLQNQKTTEAEVNSHD